MDATTAGLLWLLLMVLAILIIQIGKFVLDAIRKSKQEPPSPLPFSEMEPEGIEDAQALTPTQFRAEYLGDWYDQQQEEE